jgi:hypothetical protein
LLSRGKIDLSKEQSANSSEEQTKKHSTKKNSQGNTSKKLAELRGDKFEKRLYKSLVKKKKNKKNKW